MADQAEEREITIVPPATGRTRTGLTTQRKFNLGTFSALRHRNYRLFFVGQLISLIGTWMQNVAQS